MLAKLLKPLKRLLGIKSPSNLPSQRDALEARNILMRVTHGDVKKIQCEIYEDCLKRFDDERIKLELIHGMRYELFEYITVDKSIDKRTGKSTYRGVIKVVDEREA